MTVEMNGPSRRRRAIIAATIDGDVSVEELAERFRVSPSTIRRDLQRLHEQGKIARTYGGATRPRSTGELDARAKDQRFPGEKEAIGRRAAQYISPGDVVFLDAGTTVGRLAVELRGVHPLTVVTPGIHSLMALHDDDDVDLIVTGGQLRHVNQGLLGPIAEQCLQGITADKVFLGAEALDPRRGISCPTLTQARLKTLMADGGREVFVLADRSKLTGSVFPYWAGLPANTHLITTGAPVDFVELFEERGGKVEVVDLSDSSAMATGS